MDNIKEELECEFENDQGRLTLITDKSTADVTSVLTRIFGITSFSPVIETVTSKEAITNLVEEIIPKIIDEGKFNPELDTFAVRCRRVGTHEFTSQEAAAYVGSVVIKQTNAKVNLSEPDFTLNVEIRNDKTFIYYEKIKGLGGLPVGSQGRVICLISSGIDSPVAAYQMLKRGCSVTLLHCDNSPFSDSKLVLNKVKENARIIQRYSLGSKVHLYTIQLGEYLKYIQKDIPPRMMCVLCKSGMYQSAELLAKKQKALAIVDGSSIGQVASQTLYNIEATRYHCRMPIFSPLISMDKLEIEAIAKEIGTYEVSILPDSGCTAVPKYPETHANLELVDEIVNKINQKEFLIKLQESVEKIDFMEK